MIHLDNMLGAVDSHDFKGLKGWAKYKNNNDIVMFDLLLNDIKVTTVQCNLYRQDLEKKQADGRMAFKVIFDIQALKQLPSTTSVKLVLKNTDSIFFEYEVAGKGGDIKFDGLNPHGQRLSLNKNGRLIVLLGNRDDRYVEGLLKFSQGIIRSIKEEFGNLSFVSYGTLLGAARSSDVIPHDDDVDIALFSAAETPEQIEAEINAICDRLRMLEYRVNCISPTQFHVAKNNFWVDIFVCWAIDDSFFMTWGINGEIDKSEVFPLSKCTLRGIEFPAPRNIPAFLEVLYGPKWQTPDPTFDWKHQDVWGKLPNTYKFLSNSINKTTLYWDAYYAKSKSVPSWPSQFACFTLEEIHEISTDSPTIIDIGCGNGRDSFFFAKSGIPVIGLDGSKQIVKANNAAAADNTKFIHCNFNDIGSVNAAIDSLKSLSNLVIYSRFFIHAIDGHAEDMVVRLCGELRQECSLAAFEFRIKGDEEGTKETAKHFRRFQNHTGFIAKFEKQGFRKIYEITGKGYAKYKNDDALVCRLLFKRS
jgi:tellurite methyltransferase